MRSAVRLRAGRQHLVLSSSRSALRAGLEDEGVPLAPGQLIELPIKLWRPSDLQFSLLAADGPSLTCQLWFRQPVAEGEGREDVSASETSDDIESAPDRGTQLRQFRVGSEWQRGSVKLPAGVCVVVVQNSEAWFRTVTAHIELQLSPLDEAHRFRPSHSICAYRLPRLEVEGLEEVRLREEYDEQLQVEEDRLEVQSWGLKRQLQILMGQLDEVEKQQLAIQRVRQARSRAAEAIPNESGSAEAAGLGTGFAEDARHLSANIPKCGYSSANPRDDSSYEKECHPAGRPALTHLWRLYRFLKQLDVAATIEADWLDVSRLNVVEVHVCRCRILHLGVIDGASPVDGILARCMTAVASSQAKDTVPEERILPAMLGGQGTSQTSFKLDPLASNVHADSSHGNEDVPSSAPLTAPGPEPAPSTGATILINKAVEARRGNGSLEAARAVIPNKALPNAVVQSSNDMTMHDPSPSGPGATQLHMETRTASSLPTSELQPFASGRDEGNDAAGPPGKEVLVSCDPGVQGHIDHEAPGLSLAPLQTSTSSSPIEIELAPEAERATALQKLQSLSVALLKLDPAATMDVSPLDNDTYEINEIVVLGRALSGFGVVSAHTDVKRVVDVCKALGSIGGD